MKSEVALIPGHFYTWYIKDSLKNGVTFLCVHGEWTLTQQVY